MTSRFTQYKVAPTNLTNNKPKARNLLQIPGFFYDLYDISTFSYSL
jgi:hypothetical protein